MRNLQFEDGKMIPASKYFSADETTALELTEEEKKMAEDIRVIKKTCFSRILLQTKALHTSHYRQSISFI